MLFVLLILPQFGIKSESDCKHFYETNHLVHFLPLTAPLTKWAAKANEIAAHGDHTDYWPTLAAAGYELKTAARRMEELYDRLGARA